VREMYHLRLGGAVALLISIFAVASATADDHATCVAKGADAIAACDRWISQEPKNAVAYLNRGAIYLSKDDDDRAIIDFNEAIKFNRTYALVYDRRGVAYFRKGQYDRAMVDLGYEIRLDPGYGPTYNNRGLVYDALGDHVRAFADYNQAIRLNPNGASDAYVNRGHLYAGRGDYNRAIADDSQAINISPNNSIAYNNRGNCYERNGDHDRAITDFNQAIKINPNFALAHRNRGLAYSDKGEYDHAIADLEEAIRLDPTDQLARQYLERTKTARAARPAKPPAAVTVPAAAEVRVALVIGNSAYQSVEHLSDPRRDAEAVADALRQVGFQTVQLALDLDRNAMMKALRSFRDRVDKADWALIYFAGHGLEIDGVNYLIPVDAKLDDERNVWAETVRYDDMFSASERAKVLRLIILDACRVNPFKDRMRGIRQSRGGADRGLAPPPESEPGTLVVYSAKAGEVAADDVDGVNSPFARAFVREIKVPGRDVRRLFDYVRDDVLDATNNRQEPYTYGSLSGRRDFVFVPAH
jgi:tetratricopeptide (TPR) repeat protein